MFTGKQRLLNRPLIEAQKRSIRNRMKEGSFDRETCLTYFKDYYRFFAYDVEQKTHKNLTSALNTICNKKVGDRVFLIKCHRGAGAYASYVFPKKTLISLIKDIDNEKI